MRRFFDRTLLFFFFSLILIGIIIYNSIPRHEPASMKVAAIQKGQLKQTSFDEKAFASISKGDSLIIVAADFKNFTYLVQTPKGERGFVSQDVIDNKGIIFDIKHIEGINKGDSISVNKGDTVTFLSKDKDDYFAKMKFKTADGKQGWVSIRDIVTLTGTNLLKYDWDGGDYYVSKKKFEQLYLGKTFEEVEQLYRTAKYAKAEKNGLTAEYDLRVFDKTDGKFYNPTITFNDNVSTSYELKLPSKKNPNAFFLKYLPLVSTFLDIDFFSQLISTNSFDTHFVDNESSSIFMKIFHNKVVSYIFAFFFLLAFLAFLFLLNHTISFCLFGLLRFRDRKSTRLNSSH